MLSLSLNLIIKSYQVIIDPNQNQVENFLPYLTGKKQLTPRARDLTFCNWATNKVRLGHEYWYNGNDIGIGMLVILVLQ